MTNEVVVMGWSDGNIARVRALARRRRDHRVRETVRPHRPLQSPWTPGSDDRDAGSPRVARAVQPRYCRTPFLNFGMFQLDLRTLFPHPHGLIIPQEAQGDMHWNANGAYRVRLPGSFLLVLIVAQVLVCPETLEMVLCGRPRGGVACLFALSLSP